MFDECFKHDEDKHDSDEDHDSHDDDSGEDSDEDSGKDSGENSGETEDVEGDGEADTCADIEDEDELATCIKWFGKDCAAEDLSEEDKTECTEAQAGAKALAAGAMAIMAFAALM